MSKNIAVTAGSIIAGIIAAGNAADVQANEIRSQNRSNGNGSCAGQIGAVRPAASQQQGEVPETLPAPAAEPTYSTRFESPILSVRGEDPILRHLTADGKLRASYLLGGALSASQSQGSTDSGIVNGEVIFTPFDAGTALERLALGAEVSGMLGTVSSGKVGIDPLVARQLDVAAGLGHNFRIGEKTEIDARAYARGEFLNFDDRVDLGVGMYGGRAAAQLCARLGASLEELGLGDLRIFIDAFGTPKGSRGEYSGKDIAGNVVRGNFGREGVSGMLELDLGEFSPRVYTSWEQYKFEHLERAETQMIKFSCGIDGVLVGRLLGDNSAELNNAGWNDVRIIPYFGARQRDIEKFGTAQGVREGNWHGFGGAGLLVEFGKGVQAVIDLRYDGERGVSLAGSIGGTFGYRR